MNNVFQIMASYSVRNPNLAAQAAINAPLDFSAIAVALAPHIADGALRNAAAAAVYQERQAQLAAGTLPVAPLNQAHLPVGQALLPVTLPAAPMLAWQLQGMTPPSFQAQPTVQQPVVVQQLNRGWLIAIVVITSLALLALLILGGVWVAKGATQLDTINAASATSAVLKLETDKLNGKADDLKIVTDATKLTTDSLKTTTTATSTKVDNLKIVTDGLVNKADDAKLIIDATSLKLDSLHTKADASKVASDALKTDLANARASLRRAIATRASTADVTAAEARMVLALKAIKISVRAEQR